MYIIVSWDIDPNLRDWATVFTDFLACLSDFKYLKVLSSTYIVSISGMQDIERIATRMSAVIRTNSLDSSFLITPELSGDLSAMHLPTSVRNQLQYFLV